MKDYWVCSPNGTSHPPFLNAHLAYKIDNGHLMRGRIPLSLHGGAMVIGQINYNCNDINVLFLEIFNECCRREFDSVLLDLGNSPCTKSVSFASALCEKLNAKKIITYIPVYYSDFCNQSNYLVPGIISGGSFKEYLESLVLKLGASRLALELDALAMDFTMPSDTSEGIHMSRTQLHDMLDMIGDNTFYSPELCSNYFTYANSRKETHFVLFDTVHSLLEKLSIARKLGFASSFLFIPETDEIFTLLIKNLA